MPKDCTEAMTYSGIRNRWLCHTRAGKPDNPDHRSGRGQVLSSRSPQSPGPPRPQCASEPPAGHPAAVGLQFGTGVVIGVGVAIGRQAPRGRLALRVARETAVAAAVAEIATLQ